MSETKIYDGEHARRGELPPLDVQIPREEIEALDRVLDEIGDDEEGSFRTLQLLRKADGYVSRWLTRPPMPPENPAVSGEPENTGR